MTYQPHQSEDATMTIELFEAALFAQEPHLGQANPPGEVRYAGYKRVPVAGERANLHPIAFPPSEQSEPIWASHVALLDGRGVVRAVRALEASNLIKP